jgi:hypothetical protein
MARVLSGGCSGHEPGGKHGNEVRPLPFPHAAIFPPLRPARQSQLPGLERPGEGPRGRDPPGSQAAPMIRPTFSGFRNWCSGVAPVNAP